MSDSVRQIRRRLRSLLLRTFALVVFIALASFLVLTGYFIFSNFEATLRPPAVAQLEGYYAGKGSWDGADALFMSSSLNADLLQWSYLLDVDGTILLYHGKPDPAFIGEQYIPAFNDINFDINHNGEKVGELIVDAADFPIPTRVLTTILFPVALVSIFSALLIMFIGRLVMRRFVNPLADVIAAAHSVADGKLNTRVEVNGPHDLRALNESFNTMASALERNDRERRAMLADIAHELRTPLSVIRGRLEGIVDGIYTADDGQVSLALEQTYLLERLVDDLRLLTLAETRQLHFEKENVDLAQLTQRTIEMFSAEASDKNISLSLEKRRGDFTLELDAQRTEQVIGNLIGNALRYTPEGSKVWLTLERTPDSVRISVNDNGAGVPDDDLPFLFDRFWRKDKSRTRASGGTGLGLAIAKQLVEAQGGTIEARNLQEGGLQIQIVLKTR